MSPIAYNLECQLSLTPYTAELLLSISADHLDRPAKVDVAGIIAIRSSVSCDQGMMIMRVAPVGNHIDHDRPDDHRDVRIWKVAAAWTNIRL